MYKTYNVYKCNVINNAYKMFSNKTYFILGGIAFHSTKVLYSPDTTP